MNIYKIRAVCNDFFIRATDEAEAVTKFETWRDTPGSVLRPQDYFVTSVEVFLSPETPQVLYID